MPPRSFSSKAFLQHLCQHQWNRHYSPFLIGLLKVIVFAIIVINVSSYEGLNAYGGAEGVGRASTKAVVSSFFLIILANLIITGLFYFV